MSGQTSRPIVAFFVASSFLISGPESTALELRQNQTEPQDVDALRRDAEEGNADAQYNLVFSYANGTGVPQDLVTALMWLIVGTEHLAPEARDIYADPREALEPNMTSEQIAEAQRLAREWQPTQQPAR